MNWLTMRFRYWRDAALAGRDVAAANTRIKQLETERKLVAALLEKRSESLNKLNEEIAKEGLALAGDLVQASLLQKKYEEDLDATRSKLKVIEEFTVPELVASHKTVLARIDAETAIAVRTQVGASFREGE